MARRIVLRLASALLACTILLAAFPTAHAEQGGAGWSFTGDGTLTLTGANGLNAVPLTFDLAGVKSLHIGQAVKTIVLSEKRARLLPNHIEIDSENPCFTVDGGLLIDRQSSRIVCAENAFSRVAIPGYVRAVGDYAFAGHDVLHSVRFPEALLEIGNCAFEACNGLTSVAIPANAALGCHVFADCAALAQAAYADGATETGVATFENCAALKTVQLPDSIQTINARAFFGCESVKVERLPASLQTVEAAAFGACSSLNRIAFPESVNAAPDALPYPVRHATPQAQSGEAGRLQATAR